MSPMELLINAAQQAHERYTSWVAKDLAGAGKPVRVFTYDLPVKISGNSSFLLDRCWVDYGAATGSSVILGHISKIEQPCDLVVELSGRRRIVVRSLAWNGVRLRSSKAELPLEQLSVWLARWQGTPQLWSNAPGTIQELAAWLRAAGRSDRGSSSLLKQKNVVHGVFVKNAKTIYIDLGSAQVAAFEELVGCLTRNLQGSVTIDAEYAARDVFFREIEDRLYESHVTHVEAESKRDKVGRFLAWFARESESLAHLARQARSVVPERSPAGEELNIRLEEALSALDGDIDFAVTPGEKEHSLLLSTAGWTHLVPLLRKVEMQKPALPDWHIQVFRQHEAVEDCMPSVLTRMRDELTFKPGEVHCALMPQVCTIDVLVYFDQHHRVAESDLSSACNQLVCRTLGELEALCLGEVRAVRRRDQLPEFFPFADFPARYEAEASRLRDSIGAILKDSPKELAVWNFTALERQIKVMERTIDLYQPIADSHEDAEEPDVYLALWVKSSQQRSTLMDRYDSNVPECTHLNCLAGEGWSIRPAAGGLLRREGKLKAWLKTLVGEQTSFDFRAWLNAELMELSQAGAILYEISCSIGMGSALPAELTAMKLHEAGKIADAIEILKVAVDLYGQMEEGRLDAKLGLWYLDLGDYLSAIEYFDLAIERLTDKDLDRRIESFCNRGIAFQRLGHMREAIDSYKGALSVDPESSLGHYNLGQALAIVGDLQTGLPHLQKGAEGSERFRDLVLDDPDLDPVRSDPDFQALIADLKR